MKHTFFKTILIFSCVMMVVCACLGFNSLLSSSPQIMFRSHFRGFEILHYELFDMAQRKQQRDSNTPMIRYIYNSDVVVPPKTLDLTEEDIRKRFGHLGLTEVYGNAKEDMLKRTHNAHHFKIADRVNGEELWHTQCYCGAPFYKKGETWYQTETGYASLDEWNRPTPSMLRFIPFYHEIRNTLLPYAFAGDYQIYSSTADGVITYENPAFATARAAGTGDSPVYDSDTDNPVGSVLNIEDAAYIFQRAFFYFDTSSVSGTVSAADLNLYGQSADSVGVSAQKGVQAASLTTADFDSLTGTGGDNDPDGREYGHVTSWSNNTYNTITFNATGQSDIDTSGTTKVCTRSYEYDYSDSAPATNNEEYCDACFTETASTPKDPRLDVTTSVAAANAPSRIIIVT